MKLLTLALLVGAACFAQTPPPGITVGVNAATTGTCASPVNVGNIYVRSENSANGPIQVMRCTQVGASTFQWMQIGYFVGARPATCAVGDIAYDTSASAGQNIYGCTATNTWTLEGGGAPSGAAGGDLAGTYPNPTVSNLANVTNASLANSGLANASITVNGTPCTLGSSCTPPPGASITSGTFASLPGTCAHTTTQSDLYFFTPGFYSQAICTATNTWNYFVSGWPGGPVTPPPATGSFSSAGQTFTTFSTINGAIFGQMPNHTGDLIGFKYTAAPATPWTRTVIFAQGELISTNYMLFGLSFSDGTKYLPCFYGYNNTTIGSGTPWVVYVQGFSNSSTATGSVLGSTPVTNPPQLQAIQIGDDGTNLTCKYWYGQDGVTQPVTIYSASETSFFAAKPTQVGLAYDVNNSTYGMSTYILGYQ